MTAFKNILNRVDQFFIILSFIIEVLPLLAIATEHDNTFSNDLSEEIFTKFPKLTYHLIDVFIFTIS